MSEHNPLTNFYRVAKINVQLPSQGLFYDDTVVVLTDDLEVSILPMTAKDEVLLKNPDALLNGEAITGVIKSCVPAVKNTRKLLSCDIDAIMVGIRAASYGSDSSISANCPNCQHENTYSINYEALLQSTEKLQKEYEIVLSNGASVYVSPSTFEATVKQQKAFFESNKLQRILKDPNMSDESRLKLFGDAFNKVSKLNFELMIDAIVKVVVTVADGSIQEVTNKKFISEFLQNIELNDATQIETLINAVNSHGVQKDLDAVCVECGHEWKLPIEFNETNFS
jgi:hypothetical protein